MNDLVVTPEIADRLKIAGFPQSTIFSYHDGPLRYSSEKTTRPLVVETVYDRYVEAQGRQVGCDECEGTNLTAEDLTAAPTAAEIADQLPHNKSNKALRIAWVELGQMWEVGYPAQKVWCTADTIVEALAALYLRLHEVQL